MLLSLLPHWLQCFWNCTAYVIFHQIWSFIPTIIASVHYEKHALYLHQLFFPRSFFPHHLISPIFLIAHSHLSLVCLCLYWWSPSLTILNTYTWLHHSQLFFALVKFYIGSYIQLVPIPFQLPWQCFFAFSFNRTPKNCLDSIFGLFYVQVPLALHVPLIHFLVFSLSHC